MVSTASTEVMSAAQTQKESGEAGWSPLEALGLSQKELVLAEALQMEYDALSRLKHDKGVPGGPPAGPGPGAWRRAWCRSRGRSAPGPPGARRGRPCRV